MDEPDASIIPQSLEAPAPTSMKLDLPVSWQLTRARLASKGTSTLTESFQETWTLELRSGGVMFLSSPRGRVPVYQGDEPSSALGMPATVVLAETDLARLVGVKQLAEASAEDAEAALGPTRPVRLSLSKQAKGGLDVTLSYSDDEHYAIHIDVGTQTVF
jgi:hypothetical protein